MCATESGSTGFTSPHPPPPPLLPLLPSLLPSVVTANGRVSKALALSRLKHTSSSPLSPNILIASYCEQPRLLPKELPLFFYSVRVKHPFIPRRLPDQFAREARSTDIARVILTTFDSLQRGALHFRVYLNTRDEG